MSEIKLDIPNITVLIDKGDQYKVVVNNPGSVVRNVTGSYIIAANTALTSSYALTASYVGGGTIASASYAYYSTTASYAANAFLPDGVVSSSAQIQLNQISGTTFNTQSYTFPQDLTVGGTLSADRLLVSSSVIYSSGSTKFGDSPDDTHEFTGSVSIKGPVSASSGFTGSFKGDGSQLTGVTAAGTVSASSQIDITQTTGYTTFSSSLATVDATQQIAINALNAATSSYALRSQLAGVASSSSQVKAYLPGGTVSSSAQYPGWVTASSQIDYNAIQNKLSGVYSSSTFTSPNQGTLRLSFNGTALSDVDTGLQVSDQVIFAAVTSSLYGTASFAENVDVIFAGTFDTGSDIPIALQVGGTGNIISASYALTASYANNAVLPPGVLSSSTQVIYTQIPNIPLGMISTSAQFNNLSNTSASYALTASYVTNLPTIDTGSFAVTASNVFTDSQVISGALTTTGNITANNLSVTSNVSAPGYVQTPLLYNGGPMEIRSYYSPLQVNSNGAGILLNDNVGITGSINLTSGSVVGDTIRSTVNGTPIQINYGITKGDFANRFGGIKIKNYQWSGANLASQIEFWTDSEAQDYSTRRFYIDGFGKSVFTSNVEVTGSLSTTGGINTPSVTNPNGNLDLITTGNNVRVLSSNFSVVNGGISTPFTIVSNQAVQTPVLNNSGNGISINDNVSVTGSFTVSGSSTLTNIGPTILSGSLNVTNGITGSLQGTSSWASNVVSSSYTTTASYALNAASVPAGTISSSAQIKSNLPIGTVSSSTQINTGSFSGSFTGSLNGTITSASYATTASYALNSTNLPAGTVSSSTQINTGSFSGSLTGSLLGTSSWASNVISASYATTASYALNSTALPAGTVSSSTQVVAALPSGTISSSLQFNNLTSPFTGSFTGSHTGTFPYSGLTGIPSGIVSSSAQYPGWMTSSTQVVWSSVNYNTGIISSSTQLPAGTVSSSAQYHGWVTSSAQVNTGSFSGSFTGSLTGTITSASYAVTASYAQSATAITPAGTVSSSAQYPGWVTSSTQIVNALPAGVVSSSTQVTGYNIFATTGSNTFNGNQTITGSLTVTATASFNGTATANDVSLLLTNSSSLLLTSGSSIYVAAPGYITASLTGSLTGSLFGTASWASNVISSSYALTASYAPMSALPNGVVSSSAQYPGWVTSSTQIVWSSVNYNAGIVSSSAQVQPLLPGGTVSSSAQVKSNLPGGTISSSLQFNTLSTPFTGSYTGSFTGLINSASYVTPAGLPGGLVSSSTQIASFGNIRLQVATNRSNASAFYFNSNTRTSADSASPTADTAFLIQSTGLTTITVYLRQDNAGPNATVVGFAKNANGTAFSTATLVASSSLNLTADTIQTYTFNGLTLGQFDAIHIYCDPTSTPGTLYGVVIVS